MQEEKLEDLLEIHSTYQPIEEEEKKLFLNLNKKKAKKNKQKNFPKVNQEQEQEEQEQGIEKEIEQEIEQENKKEEKKEQAKSQLTTKYQHLTDQKKYNQNKCRAMVQSRNEFTKPHQCRFLPIKNSLWCKKHTTTTNLQLYNYFVGLKLIK
ncbi:hsp20-like chaperones superfamily protein [Anaeramoeba flamelloides]|uniref:Hsp20-like chaperones superfamily protein n=1 Tax=Anaeramoeba flamelloides TaxID=1746091 RepID=A0AAV7YB46_9EUKA|nr:hsp20-like chaperones superfamily protein [Anaeramoeba flamelloides]